MKKYKHHEQQCMKCKQVKDNKKRLEWLQSTYESINRLDRFIMEEHKKMLKVKMWMYCDFPISIQENYE